MVDTKTFAKDATDEKNKMKAWENFLTEQEAELGIDTVQKWLRPFKIVRFDACNLYLEAKDSFQALWFEEHIRSKIITKFVNNNHKRIKVHVSVGHFQADSQKIKNPSKIKPHLSPSPPSPTPFALSFDLLDPYCTFDYFVLSESNTLAFKILCKLSGIDFHTREPTVSDLELSAFNPIYLHGGSGSGKTHLLIATAHALINRGLKVIYARTETFTQHVVSAIRSGEMNIFRQAYRNMDVLILDDVHYFSRKGATQEELFHTFNTLHLAGKQMIMAANCSPSELEMIEPRLVSRFEWGIVLPLATLDSDHLKLMIEKKALALHFPLHTKVYDFLISSFSKNPKSINKAFQALVLRTHLMESNEGLSSKQVTVPLARQLLLDLIQEEEKSILTGKKIVQIVAEYFGMPIDTILGKDQTRDSVVPRQFAMFFCRTLLKLPFMKIGGIFSKDHSTVIFSVKVIQKGIDDNDPEIRNHYIGLLKKIQN
jgi:chromosomal replication initiator protein